MDASQFDTKNLKIFNDNAIDDATSFNFDSYVKSIKKIILHPENTTPFSICINGKWGSGKTSLMKTLRQELNPDPQPYERKVRTVWFNAWKYSNTDNLLAALASEIYGEMVNPPIKVKKGLGDKIRRLYFRIIENADIPQQITDLAKILSLGNSPDFSKWQTIPEYKKYLPYYVHFQQFLERVLAYFVLSDMGGEYNDKKGVLVIFIDDLDRCPPNNITTLLESVNLFFDQ
ncbi:MAG: P-loop NTPase fold protein, partial [Deltaproteobacteria bacterium]|nr:P-loop NTPase fold protein [Deltaproteobacteria bacterium]